MTETRFHSTLEIAMKHARKVLCSFSACAIFCSSANSGVFYCCLNQYIWDGGQNPSCGGMEHKICDIDISTESCPSVTHYRGLPDSRPRGCAYFVGPFINTTCDPVNYPSPPYWALPGFPGLGACCYSKTEPTFTQDGMNTIQICEGSCSPCPQ